MTAERIGRAWPVLAVLATALAGCGGGEAKEPEAAAPGVEVRRRVNVEVEAVVPASFTEVINIIGVVAANRDVTVAAEEGGVVRRLYVEKGAAVRAGQPIAKIDDALLAAQVQQAEADAALAAEAYERQRRLWEEEKIGTEMAYLQAKYAAARATASATLLSERLERTTVRAPIAGVLDARMVEVGSMVSTGTPVARLVDVSTVKVAGGIPERYAQDVARGARARIAFDVMRDRVFEGRLAFVGAAVNEQDRTFPVEVAVRNAGRAIKPGMVANVAIELRTLESAIAVPQEAVLRTEGGYLVYVAAETAEGVVAEARRVETGPSQGSRVVVASGLAAGDRVIVVGQNQVAPGDLLQVVGRRGEVEE